MLAADNSSTHHAADQKVLDDAGRFRRGRLARVANPLVHDRLAGRGAAAVDESETSTFCHGDEVTMADICLASIVVVTRVFSIAVSGIPTVNRIMFACEKLDAFASADPYRQIGAPVR